MRSALNPSIRLIQKSQTIFSREIMQQAISTWLRLQRSLFFAHDLGFRIEPSNFKPEVPTASHRGNFGSGNSHMDRYFTKEK